MTAGEVRQEGHGDSVDPADMVDPVDPGRATAAARLLTLLASARPADARAVAAALPEADLAAGVDALQGRISLPVREYILADGPSAALAALARHAILGRGEGAANAVDRALLRCDPEADAVFFFDLDPDADAVARARRVILRERKGPDGRAVIPPRVKQSLLDAVAAAGSEPGRWLLSEVASADDPDLVLALMPHAARLSKTDAARVITTLDAHGLRREAKNHRALWSGRGRSFTILGFRRFAAPRSRFSQGGRFSPVSDGRVEPVTADEYRYLVGRQSRPGSGESAVIRTAARLALRSGTMTAAEVLAITEPAVITVSLAAQEDDEDRRLGERRAADDLRVLIAELAAERLGDDAKRWGRAIARVNTFAGTLPELFADPESRRDDDGAVVDFRSSILGEYDAANILLAIAPRDVAARALVTRGMRRTVTALAGNAPLCRALVELVVTRGTTPQRNQLAANEATPDSVLARLLERTDDQEMLHAILERDLVGPDILRRVYAVVRRDDRLREWVVDYAGYEPAVAMDALRHMADAPAWVAKTLRDADAGGELDEVSRIAAFVLLAEMAGVEAVWAWEMDRVGSLEAMAPYVRESMAVGNAEPLIEAARVTPLEEAEPDPFPEWSRIDEDLDRPLRRPLEELVRTRLDGRVERWLRLGELLGAKPGASDEELIMEIGGM